MKMKKTVLENIQGLIECHSIIEIAIILERLHEKYSTDYDIVCLEGFDIIGYNYK